MSVVPHNTFVKVRDILTHICDQNFNDEHILWSSTEKENSSVDINANHVEQCLHNIAIGSL